MKSTLKIMLALVVFCSVTFAEGDMSNGGRGNGFTAEEGDMSNGGKPCTANCVVDTTSDLEIKQPVYASIRAYIAYLLG